MAGLRNCTFALFAFVLIASFIEGNSLKCYQCNDKEDFECQWQLKRIAPEVYLKPCSSENGSSEGYSCYSINKQVDGGAFVERGCASKSSVKQMCDQQLIENSSVNSCVMCNDRDGCNAP